MPRAKRVQTVETFKRFQTGRKSSVGAVAVQLTATSIKTKKGVLIKAADDNAGIVYVGTSTVTADAADATSGFPILASEWVEIEVDDVSSVYVIASQADQKVYWVTI